MLRNICILGLRVHGSGQGFQQRNPYISAREPLFSLLLGRHPPAATETEREREREREIELDNSSTDAFVPP